VLPANRLDLQPADQAAHAGRCHGHKVALAVGLLDACQPERVSGKGTFDHQQAHEVARLIVLHNQAIAGKDIVCAGMVQAEEIASSEALALRLAFPHIEAVYTRESRAV